jgi:hypothetical protein
MPPTSCHTATGCSPMQLSHHHCMQPDAAATSPRVGSRHSPRHQLYAAPQAPSCHGVLQAQCQHVTTAPHKPHGSPTQRQSAWYVAATPQSPTTNNPPQLLNTPPCHPQAQHPVMPAPCHHVPPSTSPPRHTIPMSPSPVCPSPTLPSPALPQLPVTSTSTSTLAPPCRAMLHASESRGATTSPAPPLTPPGPPPPPLHHSNTPPRPTTAPHRRGGEGARGGGRECEREGEGVSGRTRRVGGHERGCVRKRGYACERRGCARERRGCVCERRVQAACYEHYGSGRLAH